MEALQGSEGARFQQVGDMQGMERGKEKKISGSLNTKTTLT